MLLCLKWIAKAFLCMNMHDEVFGEASGTATCGKLVLSALRTPKPTKQKAVVGWDCSLKRRPGTTYQTMVVSAV